jgi:hypothetical protein
MQLETAELGRLTAVSHHLDMPTCVSYGGKKTKEQATIQRELLSHVVLLVRADACGYVRVLF